MKKLVVIINGKPQSGKDKFVELCTKYAVVKNVSSIGLAKDAFHTLFYVKESIRNDKNDAYRMVLSMMKRMSIEYNDAPFRYCRDQITKFLAYMGSGVIFVHIREPEEITKIVDFLKSYQENKLSEFDYMTLKIESDRSVDANNPSDKNVDDYEYDMTLINPGTEEAYDAMARSFIEGTILA